MHKATFIAIGVAFALIIGAVLYMGLSWDKKPEVVTEAPQETPKIVSSEPQPEGDEAPEEPPSTVHFDVLESSDTGITLMPGIVELADQLNDPQTAPEDDLDIVEQVTNNYIRVFDRIPGGGENFEITGHLIGKNSRKLAFLPPKHRVINSKGELIDRWGTPYHFHSISKTQLDVRSAGPDKKLFSEDDIVTLSETSL